jgi:hypothetical protein
MDPKPDRRVLPALLALVFTLIVLETPLAQAAPVRLRVGLDQRVVAIGDRARVRVEFLDQDYRGVPNDRTRGINLEVRATGSGSGEITPTQVMVSPGAWSSADITFTAKASGRLTILASSDGLAPGEELVAIVPKTASVLSRMLLPQVYAQASPSLRIYPNPKEDLRIPLNGTSSAQLWVTLDPPSPSDSLPRHARVTTSPIVDIVYQGKRAHGFVNVEISKELGQSDRIDILATDTGAVTVTAELVSSSETDTVRVEFVAPRPSKILFDPDQVTVPSQQRLLPLTVRLGDQQGLRINTVDRAHKIGLRSATDRPARFTPTGEVVLSPTKPAAHAHLDLQGVPTGTDLVVLAEDGEGDLEPGSATVKVSVANYVLLLLAGFGGVLGGLARHMYRVGTPALWPARIDGRLEPGALGNGVSGIVFGVMLFQAAQLGFLYAAQADGSFENRTLAFFLGVMGGVAGILVGERLIDKILPESKGTLAPARG